MILLGVHSAVPRLLVDADALHKRWRRHESELFPVWLDLDGFHPSLWLLVRGRVLLLNLRLLFADLSSSEYSSVTIMPDLLVFPAFEVPETLLCTPRTVLGLGAPSRELHSCSMLLLLAAAAKRTSFHLVRSGFFS